MSESKLFQWLNNDCGGLPLTFLQKLLEVNAKNFKGVIKEYGAFC